jgi:hypothetical protein
MFSSQFAQAAMNNIKNEVCGEVNNEEIYYL